MKVLLAVSLLISSSAVQASTSASWAKMNQRVNRACVAMSGLARPKVLAHQISYSDTIGVEVRMLRGPDSRGRVKRLLCAYNRSTGRTEVQDAGAWLGATVQP